jgi:hypothetical protein
MTEESFIHICVMENDLDRLFSYYSMHVPRIGETIKYRIDDKHNLSEDTLNNGKKLENRNFLIISVENQIILNGRLTGLPERREVAFLMVKELKEEIHG